MLINMGKYINQNSKGDALPYAGKVDALINDGAKITHPEFQPNLICVVENPAGFDAALYCETEQDFIRTTYKEDTRKKVYLIHNAAAALVEL